MCSFTFVISLVRFDDGFVDVVALRLSHQPAMMRPVSAFCLDLHARYQCQHSGACCESWSVPAEPAVVEIVRARGIRRREIDGPLFLRSAGIQGHESWSVARDPHGACVFFDRQAGSLCIIHRDVGEYALPSACRHFPRQVLHDARGTLLSLSHFCPTAAALLLADGALSIVEAGPPLRLEGEMEGLDARETWPPLLRPGLLCDVEGYATWERAGLANFARSNCGHATCLDDLAAATEVVLEWKPGTRALSDWVLTAFATTRAEVPTACDYDRAIERVARLTAGAVGNELLLMPDFESEWKGRADNTQIHWFERGMKNYLAARLFGNWIAYQGQGLRSIVEWLRTCAAVVHHFMLQRLTSGQPFDRSTFIEAIRSADLLLLHVLHSGSFARDVASVEESSLT